MAKTPKQKKAIINRLLALWIDKPWWSLAQLIGEVYTRKFTHYSDSDFIGILEYCHNPSEAWKKKKIEETREKF